MTNISLHTWSSLISLFALSIFSGCPSNPENPTETQVYRKNSTENSFRILILGDSLTEGYGVSAQQAFPSLLEKKLNNEFSSDKNSSYEIINAGISGSTSSGGVSRIEWLLKSKPDFLILALGGNDGLRGVPVEETKNNLEKIILAAKSKNIPTLLAGMKMPPNYGIEYTREFSKLFEDLANQEDVPLIPFLLEGVGGNPAMNLPDRIHPNPAGHQKIAETVFQNLINHLP
jgi:acyl-CoA thioesterase-1